MAEIVAGIRFVPAHPIDMREKEILADDEHASSRWPDVARQVSLYVDSEDYAAVFVAFVPQGRKGNADVTRCYRGRLGLASEVPDPVRAVQGFEAIGQAVEDQFAAKLAMFFGEPGAGRPEHWHAQ